MKSRSISLAPLPLFYLALSRRSTQPNNQQNTARPLWLGPYGKSGLTQRAFAKREGIKYFTFIDWLQQARQRGEMAMTPSSAPPRFQELNLAAIMPAKSAMLEVSLPGGMTVRGENAAAVAELVRALQPAKGPGC